MSFIFSDNSSNVDELSQMLDELSKVTFGASCHFGRVVTLEELQKNNPQKSLAPPPPSGLP